MKRAIEVMEIVFFMTRNGESERRNNMDGNANSMNNHNLDNSTKIMCMVKYNSGIEKCHCR